MKEKNIKRLPVLLLAAIFLLSMVSYSTAQDVITQAKGGKDKTPPALYKVSFVINSDELGFETQGCGSIGYFYTEEGSLGRNLLLNIESEGSKTPGPDGLPSGDLNMWVNTGITTSIWLEGCEFNDGCHGETSFSPGMIFIRIPKGQDGFEGNGDIHIRWWLDQTSVQVKKKILSRGWLIYTLPYEESPGVYTTALFPEDGLGDPNDPNDLRPKTYITNVIGPFVLQHDGIACPGGEEEMWSRRDLGDFNIQLTIQRVR